MISEDYHWYIFDTSIRTHNLKGRESRCSSKKHLWECSTNPKNSQLVAAGKMSPQKAGSIRERKWMQFAAFEVIICWAFVYVGLWKNCSQMRPGAKNRNKSFAHWSVSLLFRLSRFSKLKSTDWTKTLCTRGRQHMTVCLHLQSFYNWLPTLFTCCFWRQIKHGKEVTFCIQKSCPLSSLLIMSNAIQSVTHFG